MCVFSSCTNLRTRPGRGTARKEKVKRSIDDSDPDDDSSREKGLRRGKKEGIGANTFTDGDAARSLGSTLRDSNVVTHLPAPGHSTLLFLGLFRTPFQLSSVNRIPYPLFLQHLYISYRGFLAPCAPPRMRFSVVGSATRSRIIMGSSLHRRSHEFSWANFYRGIVAFKDVNVTIRLEDFGEVQLDRFECEER